MISIAQSRCCCPATMRVELCQVGCRRVWALFVLLIALAFTACSPAPADQQARTPQQAGQLLDPVAAAARIAAINGAAITGNQDAVRQQMDAFNEDYRQSIKLADPARRVDRESARTAARAVDGVRSVVWIDHENLLALVVRNAQRSQQTIDAICLQLEPLGDTLGVVVNLQSGAARSGDELEILSRNCQLAPGDRAFLQANRKVDVIAPEIRRQHRANQVSPRAGHDADEAMRLLEATTPQM